VASVLFVEDDEEAAEPIRKALRLAGHRVLYVPNGHDALALLVLRDADVVVTDLRVPGMDDISLVTVIRSYLRWQSLPIIVYSGHVD